jgi:hypothetical protein
MRMAVADCRAARAEWVLTLPFGAGLPFDKIAIVLDALPLLRTWHNRCVGQNDQLALAITVN